MTISTIVAAFLSFLSAAFTPMDFDDAIQRLPERYYCGGHVVHVERDYGMAEQTFDAHEGIFYARFTVWVGRDGPLDDICRRSEVYTVRCGKQCTPIGLRPDLFGSAWVCARLGCYRTACPSCPLAETGELIEDGE